MLGWIFLAQKTFRETGLASILGLVSGTDSRSAELNQELVIHGSSRR